MSAIVDTYKDNRTLAQRCIEEGRLFSLPKEQRYAAYQVIILMYLLIMCIYRS